MYIKNSPSGVGGAKKLPLGGWGAYFNLRIIFFVHFFGDIRFFNYFCKVLANDGNFVTQTYMRRVLHFHYLHNDGAT